MNFIQKQFLLLQQNIHQYEQNYGRKNQSVSLLAVSKGQPLDSILKAYEVGLRQFGENYLQEALPKIAAFSHYKDIEWFYIGKVQTNKTKKIAEFFSWVLSVDHERIAKRLNDERPKHFPPLNICIQINLNHEVTKSGVQIDNELNDELLTLAEYCSQLPHLRLRGLMAIPKPLSHFQDQRKIFHQIFLLYEALKKKFPSLDTLSMGMSYDYEAAIAEGATQIRVGRSLFGDRK